MAEITIPEKVKVIEYAAFSGCAFTKIIIPSNVESIKNCAFMGCEELTEIVFSEGVKEIENNAFSYCNKIKEVYFPKTLTSVGRLFFDNFDHDAFDGKSKVDIYYAGTEKEWNNVSKSKEFEDGIIPTYHFNSKYQTNGRWIKSGSRWWYRYEDGSYPKNKLCKIGNTWYGLTQQDG